MAITITDSLQTSMSSIGEHWRLDIHPVVFGADENPVTAQNEFPGKKQIGFNINPNSEEVTDEILKTLNADFFVYDSSSKTATGVFLYNVDSVPEGLTSESLSGCTVYYDTDTQSHCDTKTIDIELDNQHFTITE